MKNINDMSRKELEKVPYRSSWDEEIRCNSLIILPSKVSSYNIILYKIKYWLSNHIKFIRRIEIYSIPGVHDSGYRCMDFIAVKDNVPICRLSGYSDVIHIDGIGGYGYCWTKKYRTVPKVVPPSGWNMDCLLNSGLLRIWPSGKEIICGIALSSFEIYAVEKGEEKTSG